MGWQAYIGISILLISFRVIVTRLVAVKNPDKKSFLAVNAAAMTVMYACGLIYVMGRQVDSHALTQYWPFMLLGGLLFALSNGLMLKLFSYVDSSVGTVIGTVSVLFTSLFAYLLLGERLTTLQLFGSLLLLPSVCYVVLLNRKKSKVRKTWQVVGVGLSYTLFAGLALTNEKYLLSHISIPSYVLYGWGAQVLMCWVLALSRPKHLAVLKDKDLWNPIIAMGVLIAGGGLTFIEAQVKSDNVSLITAVACFRLIVIAFLGWLLLHERRDFWRKVFVSVVAAIGVLLMVI